MSLEYPRRVFRPALVLIAACSAGQGGTPILPEDCIATFTEVRDCRRSPDHDLRNIRIFADPDALAPYTDRVTPFPPGAVLVKEEYDFAGDGCTGPILEWTVMMRRTDATNLGWIWQRIGLEDDEREIVGEDEDRCIACHSECGQPPGGHDSTCAPP
jgi:hypothetical protein